MVRFLAHAHNTNAGCIERFQLVFLSTSALKQLTSSDISLLLRFNILRNGLFCARSESDQPELLNYFVNIFLKSQLRYGLCASVWSQNVGRVHRVSQQLEVRALCMETVRKYPEVISFFFSKEKKGDKFDRNCKN